MLTRDVGWSIEVEEVAEGAAGEEVDEGKGAEGRGRGGEDEGELEMVKDVVVGTG